MLKFINLKDFTKHGLCWEGEETPPPGGPDNTPPAIPPANPPAAEPAKPNNETAEARAKAAEDEAARLRAQVESERTQREALQREKEERERKQLEEEGNWKELANKESQRAAEAKAEVDRIRKEADDRILETEIKTGLALAGVEDADYALFIDRTKIRVENGKVVGLDDALKDLKEKKPHIFTRRPASTTSSTASPAPVQIGDAPPLKDVRHLSKAEYDERKRKFMTELKRA